MASPTQALSKIGRGFAWLFGILFLLMGLKALGSLLLFGTLFYLSIAAAILPPISHRLQDKIPQLNRASVQIVLIAIAFMVGPLILTSQMEDSEDISQPALQVQQEDESVISQQVSEDTESIDYQIVYELDDKRYDNAKSYYVLVNEIDLNNADFKSSIKDAVDEIVKTNGRKISIDFINNNDTLGLIYKSHYGTNTLGRILTEEELNQIAVSLIATFDGQLESGAYFNTLSFFPGAFSDHETVGKYVETIEYNPGE